MEISEPDGGRSKKCTLEPVAQVSLDRNLEELVKDGGRLCSVRLGSSRGGRRSEMDR
ncbi:hypothetical protein PIB30_109277, partial [Stylosanthes scabra]|nr:hypothetical protein [Stylosanthes scabra]